MRARRVTLFDGLLFDGLVRGCATPYILGVKQIKTLIKDLQALGTKPKKGDVRKLTRACVLWFTEQNDKIADGNAIETSEREDLYTAFEGILAVAGHPSLLNELHDWREW